MCVDTATAERVPIESPQDALASSANPPDRCRRAKAFRFDQLDNVGRLEALEAGGVVEDHHIPRI